MQFVCALTDPYALTLQVKEADARAYFLITNLICARSLRARDCGPELGEMPECVGVSGPAMLTSARVCENASDNLPLAEYLVQNWGVLLQFLFVASDRDT